MTVAKILISDELFGSTGGERYVELLVQGEAGIRKVMGEAKAAGAVINEALVMRADELDKRFTAIQERQAWREDFGYSWLVLRGVNVSAPEDEGEVSEAVRPSINPKVRPDNWQADMDGHGVPEALQDDPKPKGRSKGGAKKEQYKEATEWLALIAVAESGESYGDVLEYARGRAEFLQKAQ